MNVSALGLVFMRLFSVRWGWCCPSRRCIRRRLSIYSRLLSVLPTTTCTSCTWSPWLTWYRFSCHLLVQTDMYFYWVFYMIQLYFSSWLSFFCDKIILLINHRNLFVLFKILLQQWVERRRRRREPPQSSTVRFRNTRGGTTFLFV